MKTALHLLCFFLFLGSLQAQDTALKFGNVPIEDVKMAKYDKDTTAEAVVLYDYVENTFEIRGDDIVIVFTYHGILKILKNSALDKGSIGIPHASTPGAREEVVDIKGFTYNMENGQMVKEKLTKDMIFSEKLSDNYSTYKFTMPKVKVGSVIEYSYQVYTPFSVSHNPKSWTFQMSNPCRHSEYRISIPNVFFYKIIMGGYLPLAVNERKEGLTSLGNSSLNTSDYRFVVKDAPAFKDEPFITTASDYISKIDLELSEINWPGVAVKTFTESWASVARTFDAHGEFGVSLRKDGFLKDTATEIKKKIPNDTTAQIEAAVKYVQSHVKWNNRFSMYCQNIKKVVDKGEGDSGDMNMILIALLRQMGYEANPVIISTRNHGRVNEANPFMKYFNNLITHVALGSHEMMIDASSKNLKVGVLPTYCLNHTGFLVAKDHTQSHLIKIVPTETDRLFYQANLKINDDQQLEGTINKTYGGYGSWSIRDDIEDEGKDKLIESFKKRKPYWEIQKAEYNNVADLNSGVEAAYTVKINDQVTQAGNLLYLKPMFSEAYDENPFKQEEREYPVDFGHNFEETYQIKIEVPAGYTVAEAPKSMALSLPNAAGRFTYSVTINENIVVINSRFILRKPLFFADEYGFLKAFYDKIIAKQNEQIVLKK